MGRVGWILDRTEAPVHVEYCQYYWSRYWWNTRYVLESTKVPVPWHCDTVIGGGELADCEDCVKPIGANWEHISMHD